MLQMDTRTDRQMQGQCENSIPTTNKVGGVYKNVRTDLLDTGNYIYNGLF